MYKDKSEGMKDNRHEKDSHQEGISRVRMRKGDLCKGQGGKMHNSSHERAGERKSSNSHLTPRKG